MHYLPSEFDPKYRLEYEVPIVRERNQFRFGNGTPSCRIKLGYELVSIILSSEPVVNKEVLCSIESESVKFKSSVSPRCSISSETRSLDDAIKEDGA
jgi:hypothetical protein